MASMPYQQRIAAEAACVPAPDGTPCGDARVLVKFMPKWPRIRLKTILAPNLLSVYRMTPLILQQSAQAGPRAQPMAQDSRKR